MTLAVIGVLAVVTMVFKALGVFAGRLPDPLESRLAGLAPALLAGLVVTEVTGADGLPVADAKLAGVAAAVVCAARRLPLAVCVIAGAVVAAATRALT